MPFFNELSIVAYIIHLTEQRGGYFTYYTDGAILHEAPFYRDGFMWVV